MGRRRRAELPAAVLGYSMGTNIAFDLVARGLVDPPLHFFACARGAVDVWVENLDYFRLPDDAFAERIVRMGGIDARIANNKRFLDISLRVVRADYNILGQFRYCGDVLPCDVTVIYSEKDTPEALVAGWDRLAEGKVVFHQMGKNHFFIFEHYPEMARIINSALAGRWEGTE